MFLATIKTMGIALLTFWKFRFFKTGDANLPKVFFHVRVGRDVGWVFFKCRYFFVIHVD
jgi:hypothetical protein